MCSDDIIVCEHAVRRVEEELVGKVILVWTQIGSQQSRPARAARTEARAALSTGSSTARPTSIPATTPTTSDSCSSTRRASAPTRTIPSDQPGGYDGGPGVAFPAHLRLPPTVEPAWTSHGTYMAVRGSSST